MLCDFGMWIQNFAFRASPMAVGALPARHRSYLSRSGLVAQWIERLRPKEGVGGSIPSGAAILNLDLCTDNALRTREGVTNSANERAILHRGELIDCDEFALLCR